MRLLDRESREAVRFLTKWFFLSIVGGVIGAALVRLFMVLLFSIRGELAATPLPPPFWAVVGALFTGGLIYRISPASVGEGIPSYLNGMNHHRGVLGIRQTIFKYWAALLTLSTFGSGGIVGPLGRVSAGVLSELNRHLRRHFGAFTIQDTHTAAICGFAATMGAITHAPIGSGIFAVEVIQRQQMRYPDLFPAIMAGSAAVYVSKAFGWLALYDFSGVPVFTNYTMVWLILLVAIVNSLLGKGYNELYRIIASAFGRAQHRRLMLKVVVGMLLATTLAYAINPGILSVSEEMVPAILQGDIILLRGRLPVRMPIYAVFLVLALTKTVSTTVTVGSGMSAGFVGPTVLVGMLAAGAVGATLGVSVDSGEYTALLAAGFASMLASTINVPIAAAVLALELFGLSYSFPAAISAVIGYQVNRFNTLYDYASKEEFRQSAASDGEE
jgi:CIC family chloride channel protein